MEVVTMKKVLAVIAVVAVVCVAGAAFAQPHAREQGRRMPNPQVMPAQPFQPGQHIDQRNNPQFPDEQNYYGMGRGRNFVSNDMCGGFGGHGRRGQGRGRFGGMMFAPDMPENVKAKAVEVAKLRIDLEAALSAKPIDKAKAMEIFAAIQKAEQDVEAWKFGKRIEMIEAFRTQREINRNIPPAPMRETEEKPEPPAE